MRDKELIEKDLNEYPDPSDFHDMSVVSMRFEGEDFHIRFCLAKYMDDFGIVDNEGDLAILDVVYKGVKFTEVSMYTQVIAFFELGVYSLSENDGEVLLEVWDNLSPVSKQELIYFKFTYESYKWSLIDVVNDDEYGKFLKAVFFDYLPNINKRDFKLKLPKWADLDVY